MTPERNRLPRRSPFRRAAGAICLVVALLCAKAWGLIDWHEEIVLYFALVGLGFIVDDAFAGSE